MSDLRAMFVEAGFDAPEALLQSGNVIFGSRDRTCTQLEGILEAEALSRLGLKVRIFVRELAEVDRVIAQNPFTQEALADPGHLLVHFLDRRPLSFDVDRLQIAIQGPEQIRGGSKHLYILYPAGIGTSTVSRTPGWSTLVGPGTARNWNTILRVAACPRG